MCKIPTKHEIKLVQNKYKISSAILIGVKDNVVIKTSNALDDSEWLKFGKGYDVIIIGGTIENCGWRYIQTLDVVSYCSDWNEFLECNMDLETQPILASSNPQHECYNIPETIIDGLIMLLKNDKFNGEIFVNSNKTPDGILYHKDDILYSTLIVNNNTIDCEFPKQSWNKQDLMNFKTMDNSNILEFIYERMINVHGENPNYDYMHKLKQLVDLVSATNI